MKKNENIELNYITNSYLINYRKENKLNQTDLADLLGVSMRQYQNYY